VDTKVHLVTYDPADRLLPDITKHALTSLRWNSLYPAFLICPLVIKIVKRVTHDLIQAHFTANYGFYPPGLVRCLSVVSAWSDDILILPKES